jgi:DNA phosphorothioation system restriction enzyme
MTEGLQIPEWVEARPYQANAVKSWLQAGGQGILNMATGTGKTVTSLVGAAKVSDRLDNKLALIVAVPYQHLVDQWAEDIRDFSARPILAYKSRSNWQERFERELVEFNMGVRESLVVVTTHASFASDAFQSSLSRLNRVETMLIADEVHHLGAPHLRKSLPSTVELRLGLSATPQRFYDSEGTEELFSYFGDGVVYEYSLNDAIESGALCEYYYIPHIIELNDEEADQYVALSSKIARLASRLRGDLGDADLQENTSLKHALFKRARLGGTAENKPTKLESLIRCDEDVRHTLVYCGDGSVEDDLTGKTKRHVDAATDLLREDIGLRVHQFTAQESQSEREELLERFETGELQALIAIRCLDEGVDVPATKTAFMLASSSNPRQFVQRRGRILRKHEGKDYALIHDFVVAPPDSVRPELLETNQFTTERNLVRKELERVNLFAEAARNHPDADVAVAPTSDRSLQELKQRYNLRQM